MAAIDPSELPRRWWDVDKRTIEWIARLNEEERENLIAVGNMTDIEMKRLKQLLGLPEDKWQAGFRIITRSVVFNKAIKTVPRFILYLSGLLIALNQIWGFIQPYLGKVVK
ncbi:MAG TPA: hypothetical protein VGV39_14985 [Mesorhizobium sp.]|jgi:hypothetical protein|uniref:hypothetical protein n=1 Tax=Mesorhizobium sp. TaxID=1871066 RepID=UPI002DDCB16E|nr:hypothetical protein [Mesorhizobium sp.]HEV2504381.1 hypothetical protein [Mesorhizobium sp.]